MRSIHEDVFQTVPTDCLLKIVSEREFLMEPILRLVVTIRRRLERVAAKECFRRPQPVSEQDVNDKIEGLIDEWRDEIRREHPNVPFATAGVIPDFSSKDMRLLV